MTPVRLRPTAVRTLGFGWGMHQVVLAAVVAVAVTAVVVIMEVEEQYSVLCSLLDPISSPQLDL